jgi:hypothetical protein
MSEPDVDWYVKCIIEDLKDIDKFASEPHLTNSMREIIHHNTNEIEIKLHTIVRKLRAGK